MGPELIVEICSYARAIYDAVQQTSANHEQSTRLAMRVTQLVEQLQGLPAIPNNKRWLADLNTLLELVKEILGYTQKFQTKHYLRKLLFNGTHATQFADFTDRLATTKHDLLFGIGIEGQYLATLRGHTSFVKACAVTPDGARVVSGSDDDTLKVWDVRALAAIDYRLGQRR